MLMWKSVLTLAVESPYPPELKIRKMASPLKVLGLGTSKHDTSEYVMTPRYLPAVEKDTDNNAHDQGVSKQRPDCKQARTRLRRLNDQGVWRPGPECIEASAIEKTHKTRASRESSLHISNVRLMSRM